MTPSRLSILFKRRYFYRNNKIYAPFVIEEKQTWCMNNMEAATAAAPT
jgi:hypothetical protein